MTDFLFARMASPTDLSASHRTWNGNDTSQRNHNGAVPLAEDPLDIVLNWKSSAKAIAKLVGCFRLNLPALLAAGYRGWRTFDQSEERTPASNLRCALPRIASAPMGDLRIPLEKWSGR
jgi:hypothetical protein